MRRSRRLAALALAVPLLAYAGPEDAYDRTQDPKKLAWMERGLDAVRALLKDPESARFRGVYFHRIADGPPMTCGEVNARNSFGGRGGYQRFVSAGKPELTFLQEQVDDFARIWNRFCR